LYQYPGATVSQISNELDVSVEKIKRFLRDGRLEIIGDEANMILECESCGKSIKTGRFCEGCERSLTKDLKSTASRLSETLSNASSSKGSDLRYLSKDEKKGK